MLIMCRIAPPFEALFILGIHKELIEERSMEGFGRQGLIPCTGQIL